MAGSKFNVQGSKLRRGVTIMEVLFAIMVTGIGLMAALTLLPVAATQARKARTADASTSAVTAAVGYFDAMGMRKPQNWIAYNMGTGTPRYPWAEFQAGTASWFDGSQSFCIDPRMIAANLQNPANPLLGVTGTTLPPGGRSGATTFPRNIVYGPNQPAMWRLSLYSGLNGPGPAFAPLPLPKLMADSAFVFDDDLNYDRAADASLGDPGDKARAAQEVKELLQREPQWSVALAKRQPLKDAADQKHLEAGLRTAGLK